MTGSELIRVYADYQAQNDAALDELLRAVRAYAMAVSGDEDVAQEACTLVWRKLHQFDGSRGTFASWVRTITDNCRRMRSRNKAERSMVSVTEDFLADLDHRYSDPMTRTPELLRDLLLHGPEQTRELVSLACSTGDLYEAGALLGLTPNQVAHKRRVLRNFVAGKSAGA